jgi:hypothetical protein
MTRLVGWLTKRCRTRLDVMGMFGLGYVLGAQDLGTWWGRVVFLASAMGVTDMAATGLRRLTGRTQPSEMTGDDAS